MDKDTKKNEFLMNSDLRFYEMQIKSELPFVEKNLIPLLKMLIGVISFLLATALALVGIILSSEKSKVVHYISSYWLAIIIIFGVTICIVVSCVITYVNEERVKYNSRIRYYFENVYIDKLLYFFILNKIEYNIAEFRDQLIAIKIFEKKFTKNIKTISFNINELSDFLYKEYADTGIIANSKNNIISNLMNYIILQGKLRNELKDIENCKYKFIFNKNNNKIRNSISTYFLIKPHMLK